MSAGNSGSRWQCLDVLRAVAVILVILRHGKIASGSGALPGLSRMLERGGWTGVDLFFVLSGFLISGLLFREFERTGRISHVRFLIRRGFRIYPPLWFLLICTAVIGLSQERSRTTGEGTAGRKQSPRWRSETDSSPASLTPTQRESTTPSVLSRQV